MLNYSLEEIYKLVGQYDLFLVFNFHQNSSAHLKYGSYVTGNIIYKPSQRKQLEESLKSPDATRSDGIILIDTNSKDDATCKVLRTEGFLASDIRQLSTVGGITEKVYKKNSVKEIPNTINVDFESNPHQIEYPNARLALLVFTMKLQDGSQLTDFEIQKYWSLQYLLDKSQIPKEEIEEYLVNPQTGLFYEDVAITIFGEKYFSSTADSLFINAEEYLAFKRALKSRRIARFDLIKKQLGVSDKHLNNFKAEFPEEYIQLYKVVLQFEQDTLSEVGYEYPVYWDFDRFIHITLRHFKDFLIKESTKGQGTTFLYTLKDLRRVIGIVLKAHQKEIEANLKLGKGFSKRGEESYYYNGDYYSFRISESGKLMMFHPLSVDSD